MATDDSSSNARDTTCSGPIGTPAGDSRRTATPSGLGWNGNSSSVNVQAAWMRPVALTQRLGRSLSAALVLSCTAGPVGAPVASKPRAITRGPWESAAVTSDTQATTKPPPGAAAIVGLRSDGVVSDPVSAATSISPPSGLPRGSKRCTRMTLWPAATLAHVTRKLPCESAADAPSNCGGSPGAPGATSKASPNGVRAALKARLKTPSLTTSLSSVQVPRKSPAALPATVALRGEQPKQLLKRNT